jgi:hypothetical protein
MTTTHPPLAWTTDEYGTSNLHLPGGGHVWIQARRTYCDRGHWEWGSTGISQDPTRTPSYYYMDLARCRAEVEQWLMEVLGGVTAPGRDHLAAGTFSNPHGRQAGWTWQQQGQDLVAVAADARLRLDFLPSDGSAVVTAEGIPSLDGSDRFPRRYLDADVAQAEVEDFLAWRLLEIPKQIPGPLRHDPIAVRPDLAALVETPTPPQRRPKAPR